MHAAHLDLQGIKWRLLSDILYLWCWVWFIYIDGVFERRIIIYNNDEYTSKYFPKKFMSFFDILDGIVSFCNVFEHGELRGDFVYEWLIRSAYA